MLMARLALPGLALIQPQLPLLYRPVQQIGLHL